MACLRDALQDVLATRANYFPAPIPLDDNAQSNGLHQRISRAHAAPPARSFPFPQRLPQIPNDEPAPSARRLEQGDAARQRKPDSSNFVHRVSAHFPPPHAL
ncbi:hypothetical protein CSOJ01_10763 [Colletotrichum sojae]|uniref:Uncharacterized protein n=1 Tax=Colletotrichum sojae TaxID=2175907 RepID=A0A8H6IZJ4_9PEZI|nr:hypothetical protein CSOJ01_10763 [Colletotrichum sojae]